MTTEIIRGKLEGLDRSNILSCGDLFNGTAVGLLNCGTCGQKRVTVLRGRLLNLALESCIGKINAGRPTEIFQVIRNQMRGLREDSDLHRIFAEILAEEPNVKDTPQDVHQEEKKECSVPPQALPCIPEHDEKRATPVRNKPIEDDEVFYQMVPLSEGFLLNTVDPEEDLISFLFFKDPSRGKCVRIKYNPTEELLRGFWEENFLLRRDLNEYTATGTKARLLGKFIQRFDSLTKKQKQAIDKFFEDPKQKESVSEFLKGFHEEQRNRVSQEKFFYQESFDALGPEFEAIEGSGAPLLSFSFYQGLSGIECAIEYEVTSDFFNILRKHGFTLRDDSHSNIYVAKGDEARLFWRLLKPTGTLTLMQQQQVEAYCNWTDEPVLREEDFAGPKEMELMNDSREPPISASYRAIPMTMGAVSGSIKYVSDDKKAPLESFQLNRTKAGQIVAILKYRPDSPFLKTLRKIAKAPMSETYYFMSSKEFPDFWQALKETRSLTQHQIFAIEQFIDGPSKSIERDWEMVDISSSPQNFQTPVRNWKQLVTRLSPLMAIIPQLVPAIQMSLEKDPST